MMLSVESGILARDSHKRRLERIRAAGFDGVDFSFFKLSGENAELLGENYIEVARDIRAYADEIGLSVVQAHAPFEMVEGDAFSTECDKYLRLVRSIEAAAVLGAPYIVVHLIITDKERLCDYNREFYLSLLPYAQRAGIRIAVENLFGGIGEDGVRVGYLADPREHMEFVRSLGSSDFCICLDLGHTAITGRDVAATIRALDPELFLLMHMHDNDLLSDMHRIPYSGKIDWRGICAALREIGYRGAISLELISQFDVFGGKDMLIDPALRYAEAVGRAVVKMCEK